MKDENYSEYTSYSDKSNENHRIALKKKWYYFSIIIIVIAIAVFLFINYVKPAAKTGNVGGAVSESTVSALKKEQKEKVNPNDGVVRATSEDTPWFYTDNVGTLYFNADEFDGDTLTVPAEFDEQKITSFSTDSSSKSLKKLKKVIFSDGIQIIKDDVFNGCSKLKEIEIPASVIHINGNSLKDTPWYDAIEGEFGIVGDGVLIKYTGTEKNVVIPETVRYIDGEAFKDLTSAETIVIPESARYVGPKAFYDCTVKKITGGKSISFVANDAFFGCDWIDNIEEDFAIMGIGCMIKYTVKDNEIRIPSAVKQISGLDLKDKGHNITLIVGPNVERIADLTEFGYVKAYKVDKSNLNFSTKSGVLYNADKTTVYRYPVYKTSEKFYASAALRKINTSAFEEAQFKNCEFYDNLTTVLDKAFANCPNLESIDLPGTAAGMGTNIFKGCEKLEEVTLPDMGTIIPFGTFDGCHNLSHVIMPEGTKKIMARAFADCPELHDIYLTKTVTDVKNYASYESDIEYTLDPRNPFLKLNDDGMPEKRVTNK